MTDSSASSACPKCGEPTKPSWRICPMCETRLIALACPQCQREVKANWRRCPECEARLVCGQCATRILPGQKACPRCAPSTPKDRQGRPIIQDPVCGLEFLLVRGGNYAMGDTLGQGMANEQPVHRVTLDDFYMARFPVTQAQWAVLMDENPSAFQDPAHPVEQVTWTEACDFAHRLAQTAPENKGCTLPTEAQWEYASRSSGQDDLYAGGDDIDAVAWYEANSRNATQPVGHKAPNQLGLHDMSGNIWEWCRDTYQADAYGHHGSLNPVVESSGPDRVIRGGSWNLDAWSARCARRFNFSADFIGPGLGFRLVINPQS